MKNISRMEQGHLTDREAPMSMQIKMEPAEGPCMNPAATVSRVSLMPLRILEHTRMVLSLAICKSK